MGVRTFDCMESNIVTYLLMLNLLHVLFPRLANLYVHTQTVAPFAVASATSSVYVSKPNLMVGEAIQYTRAAVASIGILDYTHGSLSHAIQVGYV